jgi:cytochrome c-type biogenesis protein CcmH/NrfF
MRVSPSSSFWIKSAEALALAAAICFSLGATNAGSRLNNLDHRLMCTCGCNEVLGECGEIGCPARVPEMAELAAQIATGKTDQQILAWFSAKYGATVLAAPPARGFDLVAWIAPFAVFGAALLGTILLIRRWADLPGGRAAAPVEAGDLDPAERERLETIRRETGSDGGL